MATILVTGGLGYIGSHTVIALDKAGYDVIIVDNLINSKESVLERLEIITGKHITFVKADCCDKNQLRPIFEKYQIDSIIHFAGLKAVGESVKMPLEYYNNNLNSMLVVLSLVKEFSVKSLIFSSSATVYGSLSDSPFTEESPTGGCTNPYGWTKWMIEQILQDYSIANPQTKLIILRYFNPVGAHESGLIGEDPNGIPNNLFPFISRVATHMYDHLTIFGDDYPTEDGTCVRDYIHVCDLADGHVKALDYVPHMATNIDVFNLGTGKGSSVKQIVEAYQRALGAPIKYVIGARREGDLPQAYADTTKAAKILQFCANRSIDDMCQSSIKWQAENEKRAKN